MTTEEIKAAFRDYGRLCAMTVEFRDLPRGSSPAFTCDVHFDGMTPRIEGGKYVSATIGFGPVETPEVVRERWTAAMLMIQEHVMQETGWAQANLKILDDRLFGDDPTE